MNLSKGSVLFFLIMSIIIAVPFQYSSGAATNSAPDLLPIEDQREDENDTTEFYFSATDPDPDDTLTFTSSPLPPFAVLVDNGDGTAKLVLATSCSDADSYEITITVTDNGSLSDSETFDLEIVDDCDPTSPEELIYDTIEQITQMIDDGKLNEGQATSLLAKLDAAIKKLEDGKDSAAFNMLQSFINQIEALTKSGVLTYEEGQPLIDSAKAVQDLLF